jgi:hypothetical protein
MRVDGIVAFADRGWRSDTTTIAMGIFGSFVRDHQGIPASWFRFKSCKRNLRETGDAQKK